MSQADGSTAQYVLRMMMLQHMFFQTEYQGLGVKWSAAGPGYAVATVTNV